MPPVDLDKLARTARMDCTALKFTRDSLPFTSEDLQDMIALYDGNNYALEMPLSDVIAGRVFREYASTVNKLDEVLALLHPDQIKPTYVGSIPIPFTTGHAFREQRTKVKLASVDHAYARKSLGAVLVDLGGNEQVRKLNPFDFKEPPLEQIFEAAKSLSLPPTDLEQQFAYRNMAPINLVGEYLKILNNWYATVTPGNRLQTNALAREFGQRK